jgi:hypothetical protein
LIQPILIGAPLSLVDVGAAELDAAELDVADPLALAGAELLELLLLLLPQAARQTTATTSSPIQAKNLRTVISRLSLISSLSPRWFVTWVPAAIAGTDGQTYSSDATLSMGCIQLACYCIQPRAEVVIKNA